MVLYNSRGSDWKTQHRPNQVVDRLRQGLGGALELSGVFSADKHRSFCRARAESRTVIAIGRQGFRRNCLKNDHSQDRTQNQTKSDAWQVQRDHVHAVVRPQRIRKQWPSEALASTGERGAGGIPPQRCYSPIFRKRVLQAGRKYCGSSSLTIPRV